MVRKITISKEDNFFVSRLDDESIILSVDSLNPEIKGDDLLNNLIKITESSGLDFTSPDVEIEVENNCDTSNKDDQIISSEIKDILTNLFSSLNVKQQS